MIEVVGRLGLLKTVRLFERRLLRHWIVLPASDVAVLVFDAEDQGE